MSNEAAVIIGLAILLSALSRFFFHIRPKRAFCQITVSGITDQDGEQMHVVGTLFEDESVKEWQEKVDKLCQIRLDRALFINNKMLAIHEEAARQHEEKKSLNGKPQLAAQT